MIDMHEIAFTFPHSDFALHVSALHVSQGERLALIGPSGCGKTTLLHLLAGIQVPGRGTIHILGKAISTWNDHARRAFRISNIGFVFQDFELIEYLNVFDNILLPYRLNTATLRLDDAVRQRARTLAGDAGVAHRLQYHPDRLSQGEKQRVAICRAMLPLPPIILADEPTGNLDPLARDTIVNVLFDQVARTNATLIMVTHDLALAERFPRSIQLQELQA